MMNMRPLSLPEEQPLLLKIWKGVFGACWPMEPLWLRRMTLAATYAHGDHLIGEMDGRPAGFALTQTGIDEPPEGAVLAIGVLPEYHRRGLGHALHDAAISRLRERGAQKIHLGAGQLDYFWPGIPVSLPDAWPFFQTLGWRENERTVDMVRALNDYASPAWVWDRFASLGIELITAENLPAETVVSFVAAEDVGWEHIFDRFFKAGRGRDILVARHTDSGELAGACFLEADARRWAARFIRPLGESGCFLTAKKWRGNGIGMALVARANEIFQERGVKTGFIGWTGLGAWYAKLGYQVWETYIMSSRTFGE
jgi:GNAT superfamily N-acetyltransferase